MNSSNKGPSNKKKGRSKKAHVLAASVESATQNFLEKGEKIAKESQFLKEELTAAVEDVRKQGTFPLRVGCLHSLNTEKGGKALPLCQKVPFIFLYNLLSFTSLCCFLFGKSGSVRD